MVDWSVVNVFLSILAVATQVIFMVYIITEVFQDLPDQFENSSAKLLLSNCVIAAATITIFLSFVLENFVGSMKATRIIQALRVRRAEFMGERLRRDFTLLLNVFGNGLLGYILFYLNIPFVLSAETVTDAILNSLATVFLLEIDDRIQPLQPSSNVFLDMIDWDNDAARENLIKLAHDYLYYKRDNRVSDDVEVTKNFKSFAETKDESMRQGYSSQDCCRIYVDEWDDSVKDHKITVFRLANEQIWPSVYEEIVYKVRGKGAKEFISNLGGFQRIHRDESDAATEFSKKRVLRMLGKRRTKSVILDITRSQQSEKRRYIERLMESEDFSDASDSEISTNFSNLEDPDFARGSKMSVDAKSAQTKATPSNTKSSVLEEKGVNVAKDDVKLSKPESLHSSGDEISAVPEVKEDDASRVEI
mmetsp:Transcript_7934/g.10402  ORF Transcript_7934/g.10402 Transcript_7934/m.10402 type:complete len:419 (+) Transcript_7934:100-1356(+)|eukprot:CAMPEP_0198156218 /NCGR_PEP_ID=MMETSP1443-20131203/69541_1 /TAXON_ID=186043 /ORGANISM="Entomoneis sp., Strain CCMP2396" /LENGTH=418 /DNA_ID=CAMNT_0043823003 /DNA_START=448 /DNA_END=1704 /DNA_ORIENTATION=+